MVVSEGVFQTHKGIIALNEKWQRTVCGSNECSSSSLPSPLRDYFLAGAQQPGGIICEPEERKVCLKCSTVNMHTLPLMPLDFGRCVCVSVSECVCVHMCENM